MENNKRLQELVRKVFPNMEDYPMNSMTPAIGDGENGKPIISMLVLVDDEMIQDFRADNKGRVITKISTYLEKNKHNIGQDLVMRMDFYYPTGHPMFETVIQGDLLNEQKKFVEALKEINQITVWIANKDNVVEKVMNLNWDYEQAKDTLGQLL